MNNKNGTEISAVFPEHRLEPREICSVEPKRVPGDFDDNYVCPSCGAIIGSVPVIHRAHTVPRFCENCGSQFTWTHSVQDILKNKRESIYDAACEALTLYETDDDMSWEDLSGVLYCALLNVVNRWEDVITAQEYR